MAKSKIIRVTPNVQRCLDDLESIVKSLPDGDEKTRGERDINYLSKTIYLT